MSAAADSPPEEGKTGQPAGSGASEAAAKEDSLRQKQSNLQRIQLRKQAVRAWPRDKKVEKLGVYSSCKADESCKCNGWKNPNPTGNPPRPDASQPVASLDDHCRFTLIMTCYISE
jgi:histone acetyltransferase